MARSRQKKPRRKSPENTEVSGFSFEDTDYRGRRVYLPPGRWEWKILQPHPDLAGHEEWVRTTATDPDLVAFEEDVEDIEIHASYYDISEAKKYLWVPMKYTIEGGKVITAYWVSDIRTTVARVVWRKK